MSTIQAFISFFGIYCETVTSEIGNVKFSSYKPEYFKSLEQYLK